MPLSNPELFKRDQSYAPVYGGIQFGGEEETVTVRPTSSALFCVSSADRYRTVEESRQDTISPYRFTITKNESLLNGFFTRLALTEIRFPWSFPNVDAQSFTDRIGITVGATTAIITLTGNWYSPAELAAAIVTAWNTGPGAAAQINLILNTGLQFYLTASDGTSLVSIFPLTVPELPVNTYQLFDMMGWTNFNTIPALYQLSGPGENLLWTDYVDIVCTSLTYNQALKDSSTSTVQRDIIARIYLTDGDSPFNYPQSTVTNNTTGGTGAGVQYVGPLTRGSRPFLIYRQFQKPKEIRWNKQQPIGQCVFEVYDDKGRNLADLFPSTSSFSDSQSTDWNMTLLVTEN
jgi:hypothetical protein